MLKQKEILTGIIGVLLAANICGTAYADSAAQKEEARMWGGFRDKVACDAVETAATTEVIREREVVVPVYLPHPFLFIYDGWPYWSVWHHHHRPYIHRPDFHRPPRPAIGRPMPRPGRPEHIGKPAPRPGRPEHIGKPAPRPGRPEHIGKPAPGKRPQMSRPAPGQGRPDRVNRPAPRPRPQMKAAPRSRDEQIMMQDRGGGRGGPRGGMSRGPRPGGRR